MKRILISSVILIAVLFNCLNAFAISREEAKRYLDNNVLVMVDIPNAQFPLGLYGKACDVTNFREEGYLLLYIQREEDTQDLLFIKLNNISYIRKNKIYE
jgi:hypothetical protein